MVGKENITMFPDDLFYSFTLVMKLGDTSYGSLVTQLGLDFLWGILISSKGVFNMFHGVFLIIKVLFII